MAAGFLEREPNCLTRQELLDEAKEKIAIALRDRQMIRGMRAAALSGVEEAGKGMEVRIAPPMITRFPDGLNWAAGRLRNLARISPPGTRREAYAAAGRLERMAERYNAPKDGDPDEIIYIGPTTP